MQDQREEWSVTAHSCLLAMAFPVLWMKEMLGFSVFFLSIQRIKCCLEFTEQGEQSLYLPQSC